MKKVIANTFSDEDYQLSEGNGLGTLLDVYRVKPGSIRFLRIIGLLIFIIGIVTLVLILSLTRHSDPDSLFPALLGSFYALFQGGVFYGIMVRQAQSRRVIVCEYGLLQIRKIIRRNRVEEVYWKDILTINKKFLQGYSISYRNDKLQPLTLTGDYQKLDELVALITERSKKFAHTERERYI